MNLRLSGSSLFADPETPARNLSDVKAESIETCLFSSASEAPPFPFVTARLDANLPGVQPTSTPSSGKLKL